MPLSGCSSSHKLDLAVFNFVDQAIYAPLVTKVSNPMKQLRTLKNARKCRRHGLLMAVIPKATLLCGIHFLRVCFVTTHTTTLI